MDGWTPLFSSTPSRHHHHQYHQHRPPPWGEDGLLEYYYTSTASNQLMAGYQTGRWRICHKSDLLGENEGRNLNTQPACLDPNTQKPERTADHRQIHQHRSSLVWFKTLSHILTARSVLSATELIEFDIFRNVKEYWSPSPGPYRTQQFIQSLFVQTSLISSVLSSVF